MRWLNQFHWISPLNKLGDNIIYIKLCLDLHRKRTDVLCSHHIYDDTIRQNPTPSFALPYLTVGVSEYGHAVPGGAEDELVLQVLGVRQVLPN